MLAPQSYVLEFLHLLNEATLLDSFYAVLLLH